MRVFPFIKTYKGAWKRFDRMKKELGKNKNQFVTIADFSEWEGLEINFVKDKLNGK